MARISHRILLPIAALAASASLAAANEAAHSTGHGAEQVSPYAGEQSRAIKSLSPADIAELRKGAGWGLAKAAELNGVPGPAHLLELKDEIPLDAGQVAAITAMRDDMRARAIRAGARLIAAEEALEKRFRSGDIDEGRLRASLEAIAEARMELRYVHLATHLKTPALLSAEQIARYNRLRGYGDADPCASVPAGHDAALWRRHNGCE